MKHRKKIRVGVVGVGYLGRLHAQKYAMIEDAELVGVTDTDPDRASAVASGVNTKAYSDYKDLLGRVDAVSVVTPTESHCRIGLDFLSRGVHVMMEKPIATSTVEADELINAAGSSGCVLQVGHLERFNAAVAEAKKRIKNPAYIETHRLSPFPNRGTDVSIILDLMIHDIDIVLNMVKSGVESIDASGMAVISKKIDFANARIKFRNGCTANLTASRVSKERARKLYLLQSDSCMTVDYANQQLSVSRIIPDDRGGFSSLVDEDVQLQKRDAILEELKAFIGSVSTGAAPVVSGADGKKALEIAETIERSAESNFARAAGSSR